MRTMVLERFAARPTADNIDGRTYFDDVYEQCEDELWAQTRIFPKERDVMEMARNTIEDAFGGDDE